MADARLPAHAHWWPADSEISAATLQGNDLHLALSATQMSGQAADGSHVSGHARGLRLVCVGLRAASLAALPPLGELMGRVAEGRLRVAGTWHRHWPLGEPVPGPVHLQWQLAHRTELVLDCAGLHMEGLNGAAFFPSMAC